MADPFLLSDEVGRVASPLIKMVVVVVLAGITGLMIRKARARRNALTTQMAVTFAVYSIAPLFSAFDVLLGWQHVPQQDGFLGMGLAFLLSGLGNVLYFRVVLEIFQGGLDRSGNRVAFWIVTAGELASTGLALVFRVTGNALAPVLIVVHMLFSLYVYGSVFAHARKTRTRVDREKFQALFRYIEWSAASLIAMMALFAVDSFYTEFTVYSLAGWGVLLLGAYFMYWGYVARPE